jgi:hypothetical protein
MKIFIDKKKKRFYIFEILGMILIIALLVVIAIILVNPSKRATDTRNSQRLQDMQTLMGALENYLKQDINAKDNIKQITFCGDGYITIGKNSDQIDLESMLVDKYLKVMIKDPLAKDETGYEICRSFDGTRFMINAKMAEGKTITYSAKVN